MLHQLSHMTLSNLLWYQYSYCIETMHDLELISTIITNCMFQMPISHTPRILDNSLCISNHPIRLQCCGAEPCHMGIINGP